MQKRSFLLSLVFGSLLLVGCAEQPASTPTTDEGGATATEMEEGGAMEEEGAEGATE